MLWFFTDPDLFFYSGEGAREKFLPVTVETDKTIWFQKKNQTAGIKLLDKGKA